MIVSMIGPRFGFFNLQYTPRSLALMNYPESRIFMLIELLSLIAIVAVLAAILIPLASMVR
jgi:hypothetical protein